MTVQPNIASSRLISGNVTNLERWYKRHLAHQKEQCYPLALHGKREIGVRQKETLHCAVSTTAR